jgi:hypothetical protein
MITAYLVLAVVAVVQALLIGLQTWEHRRYARSCLESLRRRRPRGRAVLLVPCKGVDVGLEENLHTFFQQDYGNYELTFVVESAEDPAYKLIRRVAKAHPKVVWKIVLAGKAEGTGQKVHNLLAATAHLPPDIQYLAFLDSDARPGYYWLRALVSGLDQKRVGATTGYRWFVPQRPSLANYLAYSVNCGFAVLFGKKAPNYIWGGSWAIRRDVFERLGIREAWSGTLSDDLVATRAVRRGRLRIHFEPACMVASPIDGTITQTLSFIRRQYTIGKYYSPGGWLSALLLISFSSAALLISLAAAVWGLATGTPPAWISAAVCAVLYLIHVYKGRVRQDLAGNYFPHLRRNLEKARRFDIWAGPLVALVNWLVLASSLLKRHVTWRGIRYRIHRGGQIRLVDRAQWRVASEPETEQACLPVGPPTRKFRIYRKAG